MREKKVRVTARMFESERDYLKKRGVSARDIIRAWIIQDKYNTDSKKYMVNEKHRMIKELQNIVYTIEDTQNKLFDEISQLDVDVKKIDRKIEHLQPVKRKIIAKWNDKKTKDKEGIVRFTPISQEWINKLCNEHNILFEDIIPILPDELIEKGIQGYGKYKNYNCN